VIPRANPIAYSLAQCRPAPFLCIVLPLEGTARVHVEANSFDDQERLLSWIRRSSAVDQAAAVLSGLLDEDEA
jgi:hypothetical protein